MNEEALQLGPERNLVAVLTEAVGPARPVMALILNAGVIHRIGPHRSSVKLARGLASRGISAVRFDLSGVGDSRAPRAASDFRTQAVQDVQAVMDAMQARHGVSRFALIGICAGAVNAYATALADDRVAGVYMVDGYLYSTNKGRAVFAWAMLRAHGVSAFMGKFARWSRRSWKAARQPADAQAGDSGVQSHPSRGEFARDISAMLERGMTVGLMHTATVLEKYAYANQLQDTFPGQAWVRQLTLHHTLDIDHTVTPLAGQKRFVELVSAWAEGVDSHAGVAVGQRQG